MVNACIMSHNKGISENRRIIKAMIAIERRGLRPGDAKWHGADRCGWSKPDEASEDDEPEHWPALELSRGRACKGS